MSVGWLSSEDCPDCGGPLLDISTCDRFIDLECPGCGYAVRWHATPADPEPNPGDPGEMEAE